MTSICSLFQKPICLCRVCQQTLEKIHKDSLWNNSPHIFALCGVHEAICDAPCWKPPPNTKLIEKGKYVIQPGSMESWLCTGWNQSVRIQVLDNLLRLQATSPEHNPQCVPLSSSVHCPESLVLVFSAVCHLARVL